MKNIEIDCWEVIESYDRDEHVVARFTTESDANKFKQNHKNKVYFRVSRLQKTYNICESVEDHAIYVLECKKQAALAKLTLTEKQLLGLVQ